MKLQKMLLRCYKISAHLSFTGFSEKYGLFRSFNVEESMLLTGCRQNTGGYDTFER